MGSSDFFAYCNAMIPDIAFHFLAWPAVCIQYILTQFFS